MSSSNTSNESLLHVECDFICHTEIVEHGGWDLHEHATICRMEEGATAVVPNSGDRIPDSSFQPKAQMSSNFGGSEFSAM